MNTKFETRLSRLEKKARGHSLDDLSDAVLSDLIECMKGADDMLSTPFIAQSLDWSVEKVESIVVAALADAPRACCFDKGIRP